MDNSSSLQSRVSALLEMRSRLNVWSTFDQTNLEFYQKIFHKIKGNRKTILEIGSGYGFTSILFALLGACEVHGLELISEAFMRSVEIKNEFDSDLPVFFKHGNAAHGLPYPDGTFDCVTLVEVISHVVCDDFALFMAEVARVVRPGGIILISDGNNARSPRRRKLNQEIWSRFENGPATGPTETIDGHSVKTPYIEARKQIVSEIAPELSGTECELIARHTFCFSAADVAKAAVIYRDSKQLPTSVYREGICPIDPVHGMYIEKLFDPFKLRTLLKFLGFRTEAITTRRKMPGQWLWDALPSLTMLLSNGFVLIARKSI